MKMSAFLGSVMVMAIMILAAPGVEAQDSATSATMQQPAHGWRGIALSDSREVAQQPRRVASLDALVEKAIRQANDEAEFKSTSVETSWGTIIDARDPADPRMGSFQGDAPVYPASVVKMCYMVAAFDHNRMGLIEMDEALRDDLRKMIGPSDNAATNRILDHLANTEAGEGLQGEDFEAFAHKRQIVHRYMKQLGLDGLWAVNKTYDGNIRLYGRERQFLGESKGGNFEKSNKMTTDDTARLLYLIWRHAVVDYEACEEMLDLMWREEGRPRTFFTSIKPEGWQLYSKDGSTGVQRHEAAIFVQPDGAPIIVVFFTNHLNVQDNQYGRVIQRATEIVLDELAGGSADSAAGS